jgi:hypothetical protein
MTCDYDYENLIITFINTSFSTVESRNQHSTLCRGGALNGLNRAMARPSFFFFIFIGMVSYIYVCAYHNYTRCCCGRVVECFIRCLNCPGFNSLRLHFLLFIKFFQFWLHFLLFINFFSILKIVFFKGSSP